MNNIIQNISILHSISSILLFIMNHNYLSLILKIIFIISGMNIIYSNNDIIHIFNYTLCLIILFTTLINSFNISNIIQLFSLILNVISIKLILMYKNIIIE